jgi:LPS-assembly protein
MRWSKPFVFGNGQILTLTANVRGDTYHIDNNDPVAFPTVPAKSQFVSRGVPYFAVDWRWPFVRGSSTPGRSYLIEPIAQVIAQPYGGNPPELRALNEDSVSFEYDENSLFSFNHVPGFDLVESGPRANVGVRGEVNFQGGSFEAILGQTYRLKADPIFAPDSGMSGTASDIVGRFSLKFPGYFNLVDRLAFDKKNGTLRRHEIYAIGTFGRSSFQVGYVQLPTEPFTLGLSAPREEVTAQADINLFSNWQAFAAVRRNLITSTMIDTEYGLGYEDDCLGLSLAYRRHFTGNPALGLPPSTSVILRFSLKTGGGPVGPFSLFPQDVFANRL